MNGVHGLELAPGDVARLTERTEGWAAGLYLAVLSLSGRDDAGGFIADFAGDDRHVVDYLGAEVLAGQPQELRDFLLRTSILDRLAGPLCDALSGRQDSGRLLAASVRSNFFVVALDRRGEWYRYHHLFAELLRHELDLSEPGLAPELHRRAAAWFLAQGQIPDALQHTLDAGDFAAAGELIAAHWAPTLLGAGGDRLLDAWLSALPEDILRADVRLCFARCFASLSLGELEEVDRWLAAGREAPQPGPFLDGASSAAGALACVRAALLWERGDASGAMEAGHEARAAESGSPWEAIGVATIGLAHVARGEWARGARVDERLRAPGARLRPASEPRVGPGHGVGLRRRAGRLARGARRRSRLAGDRPHARHLRALVHLARASRARPGTGARGRARAGAGGPGALGGGGGARLGTGLHGLAAAPAGARARCRRRLRGGARPARRGARRAGRAPTTPAACPSGSPSWNAGSRACRTGPASGEPLSERELSVLALMPTELSQREIGRELYLSLNTVKTHARNIFRKLGVTSSRRRGGPGPGAGHAVGRIWAVCYSSLQRWASSAREWMPSLS